MLSRNIFTGINSNSITYFPNRGLQLLYIDIRNQNHRLSVFLYTRDRIMKIMEILIQIEPSKDLRLQSESYSLMKDSDTRNLSTLNQGSPGRRLVLGR